MNDPEHNPPNGHAHYSKVIASSCIMMQDDANVFAWGLIAPHYASRNKVVENSLRQRNMTLLQDRAQICGNQGSRVEKTYPGTEGKLLLLIANDDGALDSLICRTRNQCGAQLCMSCIVPKCVDASVSSQAFWRQ